MRKIVTERRRRGVWFYLCLYSLVGWCAYWAFQYWSLVARVDQIRAKGTPGSVIGSAIGYSIASHRLLMDWAIGAAVLAGLLFLARGRLVSEVRWVDDDGNEVQPLPLVHPAQLDRGGPTPR